MDAVNSLKDWEKQTLKEVDPNYEVSDDSDDEGKKAEKEAARLAAEQNAAAETPADAKNKKGGKK